MESNILPVQFSAVHGVTHEEYLHGVQLYIRHRPSSFALPTDTDERRRRSKWIYRSG